MFVLLGIAGLRVFNYQGSQSHLSEAAEAELFDWIAATLPRNTGMIGAWVGPRSMALNTARQGFWRCCDLLKIEYRKPDVVSRKIDAEKQKAFIARQFKAKMLGFLIEEVPKNWASLSDSVTDNFRVIDPKKFRTVR